MPKKFGRFEIVREIGKGAMGQVFLAHDPKIDRQVAIKTIVLPPGTSEEEAQETSHRFQREAQAAGRLLHPNIVTIFDVGEEEGVSFIAMEFIDGTTLDRHARPGTLLPAAKVLDLLAQAASALDHAHHANVIHRDIKPANLMMLKDGTLKVTDFGLAKNPSANLTQTGILLGTPSYMSPEQIQGKDLDGRSDLFSLAVVLYELLTGVRPFEADSISTIIYRVLYEDPRPPAAHNPALPPEVNLVIEKGLAKAPDRRYRSGAAMVADLRKAFASLPQDTLSRPFPGALAPSGAESTAARAATRPIPPAPGRGSKEPGRRRASAAPNGAGTAPGIAGPALLAHQPMKIAALVLVAIGGLTIFPRWVNRFDRTHPRPVDARLQAGAAGGAFHPAAIGGGPPEEGDGSGPTGRTVAIDVETMPHGGAIFLDDIPLAAPRVVLSRSDPKPHDIQARAGCMEATAEMTAADLASFSGPLVLELRPRRAPVLIGSEPRGARIRLNGRDTGKETPVEIEMDGCEDQEVELTHAGFRPWSRTFASGGDFAAMTTDLGRITLEEIAKGTLLVSRPKAYPLDIYAGTVRIGRAGEAIELQEGKHTLTFRNDAMFVRETAQVTVEGGRTLSPAITFPGLGALTVQAQPSNCKVFVDGQYIDVTPVLERPMAAGGHKVKVVFVPNGAAREVTTVINAGKTARVMVKF